MDTFCIRLVSFPLSVTFPGLDKHISLLLNLRIINTDSRCWSLKSLFDLNSLAVFFGRNTFTRSDISLEQKLLAPLNMLDYFSKVLIMQPKSFIPLAADAFFWVGTSETPDEKGSILPYPFQGKFFKYDDDEAPILKGTFDGSVDIKLTLPEGLNVSDLKWFSIWLQI